MRNRSPEMPHAPASRRKRILLLALATSPIWLIGGLYLYSQYRAGSTLRQAVLEADRLDPGWRLGNLEARRVSPPDEENPALRVLDILRMPPKSSVALRESDPVPDDPSARPLVDVNALETRLGELEPPIRPDRESVEALRDYLADRSDAVALARSLADTGEGRFPLKYDPVIINTLLPHIQNSRNVVRMLQKDAALRAEEGDIDGAIDTSRAILGMGRAIGDEPFAISQLVRMAFESVAVASFQRTLAQGEASSSALARMQADLADEEAKPLLLISIRGERATSFDLLDGLASGRVAAAKLGPSISPGGFSIPFVAGPLGRYNQGLALKMQNRAVEIARKPLPEQAPEWARLQLESQPSGGLSRYLGAIAYMLVPANESIAQAYQRTRANLACARALAACERFRIDHGRWPGTIESLVPRYLPKTPEDPYTGRPLHLLRKPEGLWIYATGPDMKDHHGYYHPRGAAQPGYDVGLRLWDVSQRRQAPEAKTLPDDVFQSDHP